MITYLSPSSINLFYQDQDEFYMRYICQEKPPRPPQTLPMAAGSAFDAFVKSYLHESLFGKGYDPKFDLKTLFEAQVESQLRDQSWSVGEYLFKQYQKSGALADLMTELSQAITKPMFEIEVKGVIDGYREGVTKDISGVVFLGKPDVFYINKYGTHVILDWKTTGFYGRYNKSPTKGYVRLRSLGQVNQNMYRIESCHNSCVPLMHKGIMINAALYLENINPDWACQLTIYALLCGCSLGEDFIVAIDEICCLGLKRIQYEGHDYPEVRIAEHRLRVHPDTQYKILAKAQHMWELVHSEHFFRDIDLEQSKKKCQYLDEIARKLNNPDSSNDDWLFKNSRR